MPSEAVCTIEHALVSVYAVDCDSGKVLIDQNSDLSMTPASCMKIVTTGAAYHLLGANTRFETKLEYDGLLDEMKTLHGNVYIVGGGDPSLGSDRIPGALGWEKQIEAFADAIEKFGIHKITGKIVGDATLWEKARAVPSWTWEDLGNYYGAGASALSFHENDYSLFFKPASKEGDKAYILRTEPPMTTLVLQNEVTTGPEGSGDGACIYGSEFSHLQHIRGTIPAGVEEFSIRGAIPDSASFCANLLLQELQKRNIIIQEEITEPSARVAFHTTYSPTIEAIIHHANQKSINLYTEHLLKKMGEVVYKDGSTASGIKAVSHFWHSQDIDLSGFNMVDGSGLSRKNLVTTKQLVEIFLKMKKTDYFVPFFESLPQKEGLMRAKSGYLSLVKGYVGSTGKIAFAVLVNQCPDNQQLDEKLNALLLELNSLDQSLNLLKLQSFLSRHKQERSFV